MTGATDRTDCGLGGVPEFQAVVLAAGRGSRFNELTRNKAKCFLPIGNLPMIWYPLNTLQRAGFQEVIVVTLESCRTEMLSLPKRHCLDLRLDVVCPSSEAASDDLGTADAVRLVHDRISSPRVLLVSCDLLTDLHVQHLTDLHRVRGAAVTALFAGAPHGQGGGGGGGQQQIPVPGPKTKQKKERDFVGLDEGCGHQIVFLSSEADLDETLTLRRSALLDHPRFSIRNDLTDAHFYVVDKWVCDYLQHNDDLSSIKGELLPLLVKAQFSKSTQLQQDPEESGLDPVKGQPASKKDVRPFLPQDEMSSLAQSLSCWNDHSGDLSPAFHARPVRCHAFVTEGGVLCARANNLYTYMDLNRQASRIISAVTDTRGTEEEDAKPPFVHPSSQVQPKAQIGPECFVGAGTYVSDKTTTKHSTLGSNCKVEEKVRVTNCILMDGVTLKEGCFVSGSLLCDGVIVPERVELKDCIVGKGATIKQGAKHNNEILMVVTEEDRMMEI